jgi:hypothetical protein
MKEVILLILIIFWIGVVIIQDELNHEEQMQKLEEIQQSIEQRNHLDSLYWEHLENCSFIHKDQISVGYQGYLYYKK